MCKMSNVRLSNGSPTLERVDARQTEPSKPPVRRNLFGSEHRNREEQSAEIEGKMQDAERVFKERWNYDISNDRPLSPGNFQWEAVKSSEVPPFYSRPPHKRDYPRGELDLNGNDSRSRAVTGSQLSEDTESSARRSGCSSSNNGSRRRPGCPSPDSPSPKKSHNSEEDDEDVSESEAAEKSDRGSSEEDGDVSGAAEQTPRRPDSRT